MKTTSYERIFPGSQVYANMQRKTLRGQRLLDVKARHKLMIKSYMIDILCVIAIVNVVNVCYCWNVVKTPCAQFNDTCRTFEGKFPLVKDFCF